MIEVALISDHIFDAETIKTFLSSELHEQVKKFQRDGVVQKGEAVVIRNYIMLRIVIINGTRSGALRNMTMTEVQNQRSDGDRVTISVSEYFYNIPLLLKHDINLFE